ncbi:MAG TPA: TetR/AcrR family transcriptional regulator [Myxococcaceae bacterium]|nr:TetR/AcrR family transcriptional regulator [Myxococcaceae bacterium]
MPRQRKPVDAYHHGDLRAALVRAGAELVARRGAAALSLRAVARKVGVSHAAPYHHFADKDGLLGAIAASGFEKLDAALAGALAPLEGRPPLERFHALGPAYVRFAAAEPHLFQLMFPSRGGRRGSVQELGEVARRPFARVRAEVEACLATWKARPVPDATQVTMLAWASMHGLATLWTQGALGAAGQGPERLASELAALVTRLVEPPTR